MSDCNCNRTEISDMTMSVERDGIEIALWHTYGYGSTEVIYRITITEDDMRRAFPNLFPPAPTQG